MDASTVEKFVNGLGTDNLFFAAIGAYLGAVLIVTLVIAILQIIAMWKLFTKAGEAGWKAIIPIYNTIIYYKISGVSPWLVLVVAILSMLSFVPNAIVVTLALICEMAIVVYQTSMLSKAFGKGIGYTIGLLFLNTIFILILGLGKAEYILDKNKD